MLATSRAAHRSRNGIPTVVAAQLVLQLVIGEGDITVGTLWNRITFVAL